MYQSMGGLEICPKCGHGSPTAIHQKEDGNLWGSRTSVYGLLRYNLRGRRGIGPGAIRAA